MRLRFAPLRDVESTALYGILALRSEVFVVEQDCVYADMDGRDLEPATLLGWAETDAANDDAQSEIVATLRLLSEPDGSARIGRVATAQSHRGTGTAARLVAHVIDSNEGRVLVLDAQAHLEGWYERFGFVRSGAEYIEDNIPHVPMRRDPTEAVRAPLTPGPR